MRGSAPAVRYPVAPSRLLARLLVVFAALQLLTPLLFAALSRHPSLAAIAMQCLVAALVCALLHRFWRAQRQRELHWDGQVWRLHTPSAPDGIELGALFVALDTQHCLLVHYLVRGSAWRGLWLWLDAATAPQHWHALRCAVYFGVDNPRALLPEEAAP